MKTVNVLALFGLVLILVGCSKEEMPAVQETLNLSATAVTGNEAPSGEHYNLNIIGTSEKSGDMDGANGHVIFVPLKGTTEIKLFEGDFAVLDANGTDDDGATFQLPSPGIDAYVVGYEDGKNTWTDYSVFVRPLGKPGGWADITTIAELTDFDGLTTLLQESLSNKELRIFESLDGDMEASVKLMEQTITLEREKGRGNKPTFTNVTAELLTLVFEVTYVVEEGGEPETVLVRVPIFDDMLENEYWEYDNHGLRILQARFYPGVSSDVTEWD